jgi:hypothetical protein
VGLPYLTSIKFESVPSKPGFNFLFLIFYSFKTTLFSTFRLKYFYKIDSEQCVFTDSWKNYQKFVQSKLAAWKDDNALFLLNELTLAVLATLNPEPYDDEAVIENLLAGIVLVAYQKRGDFVLKLIFDRFEPRDELQRFWAPYINAVDLPRPAVHIAQELLWLQARHVKNTEEFGTPYVCDGGYNKILH